jgi:hypothetical protein
VTNVREVAQLTETLKQKVQAKPQTISRSENRETQYSQNKMFKEDIKKNLQEPGHEEYRVQRTYVYGRNRDLLNAIREEAQHN